MILPSRIIALDFETTGLVPTYDYPTSLDAIVFENGEPTGEAFGAKIAPDLRAKFSLEAFTVQAGGGEVLLDRAALVDGIHKVFPLEAKQRIDVMREFALWAKSVNAFYTPVVSHKAVFDWGFYEAKLACFTSVYKGVVLSPSWICTKTLARHVIEDKVKHLSLGTVAEIMGIEHEPFKCHDSRYDAELCGRVYFALKKTIEEKPVDIPITTSDNCEYMFARSLKALQEDN